MVIDHPIFLESIRFIRSHLLANDLDYLEKKVLERLVHTSGDFSVQNLVNFSEGACEKGLQALKNGAPILTDTDMAAAAIKSMAENTTRNKVFTARMWFGKKIILDPIIKFNFYVVFLINLILYFFLNQFFIISSGY